ncbi:hypothetical protein PV08_05204 [Exophiala spinifera]|uniref:Enoyl reductase (ER) domain-containing protein n=1 Tax=Exophiala spinifera TaxID=91928 RepID=A0A0D2BV79_9EURO|nr:uncharacterized protein PV08_05204 [Exophiala spinifera]KIW15159.1 hypothetical protein PV08_05204 [Exophiala spinifera]
MANVEVPKTMLAWQKHIPSKTPVRVEIPVPTPQDDEVLVKIHAVGVCHSAYNIKELEAHPMEFTSGRMNFTMGHEGCGEVVSMGPMAYRHQTGDMVALLCVPGCNSADCPECSSGVPQLCLVGPRYGGGPDGFFAPYAVVREHAAIKVPQGVDAGVAAVATDACITSYHAVTDRAQVKKDDVVLLFGLGGLGFNALQFILHIGARVIVVDQRRMVLDEAVKFGVPKDDIVPAGTPDVSSWVRERNLRVDKVIDFVSVQDTHQAAIDSVRRGGTVVSVGLLGSELKLRTATLVRKQLNLLGSYGGTSADVAACLDLCAKGVLVPQIQEGSLRDFPQILEDLHDGKIKSRMVMRPEGMEI